MIEFIADVAANHNGDLARCRRLIAKAAAVGFRGIQFPFYRIENLYAPQVLQVSGEHRRQRREELPRHFLAQLAAWCRDNQLKPGFGVFDLDSVDLVQQHAAFLAVSPYELPWLDLVDRAADTGLPLILDTGMADAGETWNAVQTALEAGCTDLTVMRSVARYPVPAANCNLASLGTLREMLVREFAPVYADAELRAGWTDNSASPGVIARVINHWGCDAVALKFDLEGEGDGFVRGAGWLPEAAESIIAGGYLPVCRESDGNGRLAPDPGELEERGWRAEPADGLRPPLARRKSWMASQPEANRRGPVVYLVCGDLGCDSLHRCLALAECLRADHDAEILFFVPGAGRAANTLVRHGFKWTSYADLKNLLGQLIFLHNLENSSTAPVCILDIAKETENLTSDLSAAGFLTVVIGADAAPDASLQVRPAFGRGGQLESARVLAGNEYQFIPSDVAALRERRPQGHPDSHFPRVVVCFGPDDTDSRLTPMVAALALNLAPESLQVVLPGPDDEPAITSQILAARFPGCHFVPPGDAIAPLLAAADIVATGPGQLAGEALYLGVPVLLLAGTDIPAGTTDAWVASGAAVDCGLVAEINDEALAALLRELFNDPDRLSRLRFHAQELAAGPLDGRGAARIADRILQLVRTKS